MRISSYRFTGPSGVPPNEPANDTFWRSEQIELAPLETRILVLNFDDAFPWNISDNPLPHTQGVDGTNTAINAWDRTEVSSVGFQVVDITGLSPQIPLVVQAIPEPSPLFLLLVALPLLTRCRKRPRKD